MPLKVPRISPNLDGRERKFLQIRDFVWGGTHNVDYKIWGYMKGYHLFLESPVNWALSTEGMGYWS